MGRRYVVCAFDGFLIEEARVRHKKYSAYRRGDDKVAGFTRTHFSLTRCGLAGREAEGQSFGISSGVAAGGRNHEWYFTPSDYSTFEQQGIHFLDNDDCMANVKGQRIRIGGLSTRYDLEWLQHFSQKDGFKILMCHHPEYYRKAIQYTDLDTFDLIVSGHYHGGQWRIGNRAVYVPRTGLFMKDAVGQFGKLVISAGTANTTRFSRRGNPCELVMIEI